MLVMGHWICREIHAVTEDVKICQNCQIRRADFALTNLIEIHQNHHIYEHSDGLMKYFQICHFCACISGHKCGSHPYTASKFTGLLGETTKATLP